MNEFPTTSVPQAGFSLDLKVHLRALLCFKRCPL